MATNWKAQIGEGKYMIQFETGNFNLYRIVEKACQKAVDTADKWRKDNAKFNNGRPN